MIHLRSVRLAPQAEAAPREFPFDVPAIAALEELHFTAPVTLLVGENGSGKSTFLEALAFATETVAVGTEGLARDATLAHVRPLGKRLRPTWSKRTRRGFFLRAEDFFGWVKATRRMAEDLDADAGRVRAETAHLHEGERDRVAAPYEGSRQALRRYGDDPDAASHGEQFLGFFRTRFVPGGLYLLDEPEAPLSPQSQLAFLSMVKTCAEQDDAQFVLATHSPILMALPGAALLSFDEAPLAPVAWEDVEHVTLLRDFLARPDAFLRHL